MHLHVLEFSNSEILRVARSVLPTRVGVPALSTPRGSKCQIMTMGHYLVDSRALSAIDGQVVSLCKENMKSRRSCGQDDRGSTTMDKAWRMTLRESTLTIQNTCKVPLPKLKNCLMLWSHAKALQDYGKPGRPLDKNLEHES
jgi:hypothetical protein